LKFSSIETAGWSALALLLTLLGFGAYSLNAGFSNWPWTQVQEIGQSGYMGIAMSSSETQVATVLEGLANTGAIDSYSSCAHSNCVEGEWRVRLLSCNCYLTLVFDEGILSRIQKTSYYGPTKP